MSIPRPLTSQLSHYHQQLITVLPDSYLNESGDANIVDLLVAQQTSGPQFVRSIPADRLDIVHEGYGWSVRQVIEHLLDAERVFGYRILRFASGDLVDLPGWDENHYASCGYCDPVDVDAMAGEFSELRSANLSLLKRLSKSVICNAGTADGNPFSVNSIAYVMAAHWVHHQQILEKRLAN
ncbi:MAG: DinB family protein [Fuerstiella sp.]